MDDKAREQAFVNAVATEHFVTQGGRAAIVGEMTGRAMIYMGAVSSALIAFGFLAPTADLAPFVAGVVPALLLFGELTFAALLRNSVENVVLLRHMQDIRSFYRALAPDDHNVFDPPHADPASVAAVGTIGLRHAPAQVLFTGGSRVAAAGVSCGTSVRPSPWLSPSPRRWPLGYSVCMLRTNSVGSDDCDGARYRTRQNCRYVLSLRAPNARTERRQMSAK